MTILAPETELNSQQSILSFPKLSSVQPQSGDITQSNSDIKIVDNIKLTSNKVPETPNGVKSSLQHTRRGNTEATNVAKIKVESSKANRAAKSNSSQKITKFFVEASGPSTDTAQRSCSIGKDAMDMPFDDDIELSPTEVKSKLTSKREFNDDYPSGTRAELHDRPNPTDSERATDKGSGMVDDSQPDIKEEGKSGSKKASKLPGLTLKSSKTSQKKTAVVYQNQSDILAPQSVESNQSFQDASIFAPSSLTPASQSKPKGSGNTSLPGASLMTELFKGRRRKRGIESFADAVSEDIEESQNSAAKKLRREEDQKGDSGLFGGLRSTRSQTHHTDTRAEDSVFKTADRSPLQNETEKDTPPTFSSPKEGKGYTGAKNKTSKKVTPCESTGEFSNPIEHVPEGPIATSTQAVAKASVKNQRIPVSPIVSDSPFISSRKQKRSLINESTSESSLANQSEQNVPTKEAAGQSDSMFVDTLSTQKTTGIKRAPGMVTPFTSPFTCLSSSRREAAPASVFAATGGRRSKAPVQAEADDLWNKEAQDENGMRTDGENPLGTQFDDPGSTKFKPVLTEDGFIKARVKPKLQVSHIWLAS